MTQNSNESFVLGRSSWQIGFIFHWGFRLLLLFWCVPTLKAEIENHTFNLSDINPGTLTSTRMPWELIRSNLTVLLFFFYIYTKTKEIWNGTKFKDRERVGIRNLIFRDENRTRAGWTSLMFTSQLFSLATCLQFWEDMFIFDAVTGLKFSRALWFEQEAVNLSHAHKHHVQIPPASPSTL